MPQPSTLWTFFDRGSAVLNIWGKHLFPQYASFLVPSSSKASGVSGLRVEGFKAQVFKIQCSGVEGVAGLWFRDEGFGAWGLRVYPGHPLPTKPTSACHELDHPDIPPNTMTPHALNPTPYPWAPK